MSDSEKPKVLVSHKTSVPKRVSVEVGTLMIDGQDGGYTMHLYPSYEAAREAKMQECANKAKYNKGTTPEDWFDDDYETGYLESDTLKLLVYPDGRIELDGECSFHVGQ